MRVLRILGVAVLVTATASIASAQHLLVPMDDTQENHLKAYGLTFGALKDGVRGEWLLNYRGGSFLLPNLETLRRKASLDGITTHAIDNAA